jgi:orotate phosphoribosyltransferase
MACPVGVSADVAPTLQVLLDLPDDALESRLMEFVRRCGVKFRSPEDFRELGWKQGPGPMFANIWRCRGAAVKPSRDPFIWDLRAPLLLDEALACCCILLWRRSRRYDAQWIGGVETASIPIVAGMLAVNRAVGVEPLNGFYLRKKRKPDGLRRLLEGVPPPRGARVLLVDDILNKGISKKPLVTYCRDNGLQPAALLVVVDTQRRGSKFFAPICPVEAIFTRSDVLGDSAATGDSATDLTAGKRFAPTVRHEVSAGLTIRPHLMNGEQERRHQAEMSAEDIELVRLARDTVTFAALSAGKVRPTLEEDLRGSSGYMPFLGRYLRARGPVFTRISKCEFKNGVWFNRIRGCQAVGLLDSNPGTIAEMTIKSAMASATVARKVKAGAAAFHKPVWPAEIGDLSLFVYLVEELVPTKARTAEELIAEGQEVHGWGLIAHCSGYRGVICGDLDEISNVARQIDVACRKMQNSKEIRPQEPGDVAFIRMKGRWIWDPTRPKAEFF